MQNLEGFLGKIYPSIEERLKRAQAEVSHEEMMERAARRTLPCVDVIQRIHGRQTPIAVFAEFKRASPNAGSIGNRISFVQAQSYIDGSAVAISVLTEPRYFSGSLDDLARLKGAFPFMPFLRKDFIVNEYQVYESKAAGADMILLITRWLEDKDLECLYRLTRELGMHALVETETYEDIRHARSIGAEIIGINARNLIDLTVDVSRVTELAERIDDKDFILVGESGVDNPEIVREWQEAGVDAVLAGGTLMKAEDPEEMVREFSLMK